MLTQVTVSNPICYVNNDGVCVCVHCAFHLLIAGSFRAKAAAASAMKLRKMASGPPNCSLFMHININITAQENTGNQDMAP